MGRQFRSRADRLAGNDPVTEAVVPDPDNGGVFHRCGSHIAHSPVGSRYQKTGPSEPVDAPPQRKRPVQGAGLRHAVVGPFRNIAGDITSVALGPPALPQVSGHFRHTGNRPFNLFVIHNSAYGWKKHRKNKQDKPAASTAIVIRLLPRHSCRTTPHTLEKTTLSDMRIDHEKASSTGDPARKLRPTSSPKNCEYHSSPARAQNRTLFTTTFSGTGAACASSALPARVKAVERIGQKTAERNQKNHRKSGEERIDTRSHGLYPESLPGIKSERKAGAHHAGQAGRPTVPS